MQLNNHLAEVIDALFKHEILKAIDDSWTEATLLDIANFKNGLAMQKYRPEGDDLDLPVLKIKELSQGQCATDAERCRSDINESVRVHDDLIFSWSSTLLLERCGSQPASVQDHIRKYDPWFYYLWINYHMRKFIALAKDRATTMGHIKRSALAESKVFIPDARRMNELKDLFEPLVSQVVAAEVESRKLTELRNLLLRKLMSGKIGVSGVIV